MVLPIGGVNEKGLAARRAVGLKARGSAAWQ
ncbi:MAG: hypothetical protein JO307_19490 [Bryobacterales bacterium]|nr:hypothetical protein [Bryobacterales bacterium]MBV9400301.1 hypothetical protein [Bryobacterales bacterium]